MDSPFGTIKESEFGASQSSLSEYGGRKRNEEGKEEEYPTGAKRDTENVNIDVIDEAKSERSYISQKSYVSSASGLPAPKLPPAPKGGKERNTHIRDNSFKEIAGDGPIEPGKFGFPNDQANAADPKQIQESPLVSASKIGQTADSISKSDMNLITQNSEEQTKKKEGIYNDSYLK